MANPDNPTVPYSKTPLRIVGEDIWPFDLDVVEDDIDGQEEEVTRSDFTSKDYIDRSMDAVRAQNDARFSEVLSKIDTLGSKIDAVQRDAITWKGVWGAAAATTVAVGGLLLGILAIGGDRFDGGMAASGVISSLTQEQQARDRAQDERLNQVLNRLDTLLAEQATPAAPAPESAIE